jgi:hypothetical protein
LLLALGALSGAAPVNDFLTNPDHAVTHLPRAVLATGLVLLGAGSVFLGTLLHAINWRFKELHSVLTRQR